MQRKSLIVRVAHPTDARGKIVRLTPKARKLFDAMMAANERNFMARLLRGLNDLETRTLTKPLGRLADNMTEQGD